MSTVQPGAVELTTAALQQSRLGHSPEDHFKRYLRFRGTQSGEVVALEAIGPSQDHPKYKFASSLLALSSLEPCLIQLLRISDNEIEPRGCFIQQNEVKGYVGAQQKQDEWVRLGKGDGLKDEDIASRRAFYFDFDPKRGKNVSSTDAELARALTAADAFLRVLVDILGDDRALGLGASGNGVHIHVALDSLPNGAEVTALVRECLLAASALVTDPEVALDTSVSDARRVCPAFGTMKRKGADHRGQGVSPDQARPHRRTGFICHDAVRRLSLDELRMMRDELVASAGLEAASSSTTTPSAAASGAGPSAWDLAKAVDIEDVSEWLGLGSDSSMTCPGCGATKGYGRVPATNVTKCLHNSCATKGNPNKPGLRTTIDLVAESKQVSPKDAVNLLANRFGFAPLGKKGAPKPAPSPPPAASGAPWESGLLRDDKTGRPLSTGANAELVLTNDAAWAGVLGYNELRNAVVFLIAAPNGFLSRRAGDIWCDDDDVACSHWLARNWKIFVSETRVRGVVSLVAHRNSFHPVRDELRSYTWDGVARVDAWLSTYLGVASSPYVRTVGRWWLISAVARAMKPGCKVDTMLILEGPQGGRKSSALRALAGGDYFLDDLRDVGGVESAKQLCGKWLVELAELDAFRKAENSTIKRFVSQQSDNYRASYGRTAADYPRQCVFAGTTNHEEYLQDETGARRFWPVLCGVIDVAAVRRDRAQLWAEALVLYSAGERWWPETLDEVEMCTREQTQRQVEEPWAGKIAAFVADKKEVTTRRVLAEALGIELGHMKDADRRRVGAVLRGLGWHRSKKRLPDGTQERVFIREPDPDEPSRVRALPEPAASEFAGRIPVLPRVADEVPGAGAAEAHAGIGLASDGGTAPAGDAPSAAEEAVAAEAGDGGGALDEEVRVVNYDFMLQ